MLKRNILPLVAMISAAMSHHVSFAAPSAQSDQPAIRQVGLNTFAVGQIVLVQDHSGTTGVGSVIEFTGPHTASVLFDHKNGVRNSYTQEIDLNCGVIPAVSSVTDQRSAMHRTHHLMLMKSNNGNFSTGTFDHLFFKQWLYWVSSSDFSGYAYRSNIIGELNLHTSAGRPVSTPKSYISPEHIRWAADESHREWIGSHVIAETTGADQVEGTITHYFDAPFGRSGSAYVEIRWDEKFGDQPLHYAKVQQLKDFKIDPIYPSQYRVLKGLVSFEIPEAISLETRAEAEKKLYQLVHPFGKTEKKSLWRKLGFRR